MLHCSPFSPVRLVWINIGMKHKFSVTRLLGTANLGSATFRAQWDDSLECINVQQLKFLCHYDKYCFSLFIFFKVFHSPWSYVRSKGERGQATWGYWGSVYKKHCGTVAFVSRDWTVSPWRTLAFRCSQITAHCSSRVVVCALWKPAGFFSIAS